MSFLKTIKNQLFSFWHSLPIYFGKIIGRYTYWPFFIILASGIVVNICIFNKNIWESIYNSIALFAFNIAIKSEVIRNAEYGYFIYIVSFLASLYMIYHIIKLLAKEFQNKAMVAANKYKSNYILVCGLGKKGMFYIDSELPNKKMIVIEKNAENPNIERYRKKGVAVYIGSASDVNILKELRLNNCKHIVLLAGKDTENIEIALAVSDVLNKLKDKSQKIEYKDTYMHLEDRDLHKFYREGGLFDDSSLLHIKMFSMAQNSAKLLFLEHDIDGKSREYIDSDKPFGIVVVGNTDLALEVIGQACEIAHFPNENVMTIYCIDNNIVAFRRLVYHRYPNIEDILTIKLEFKKLNFKSRKFYEENFWFNDITNVMLCHDDAQVNLDISSELADSTYLKDIKKGYMKTNIHIAIYENTKIANSINKNKEQFKYFDVFAETFKMVSTEIIVDEKMETIAKCIHSAYAEKYNPDQVFNNEDLEKKWFENKALTDRDSNRAQAYHLPIKVKALGLRIDRRTFKELDTLSDNRKILNSHHIPLNEERKSTIQNNKPMPLDDNLLKEKTKDYIDIFDINDKDKKIQESYKIAESFDYFPDSVETLFEKLIRSEKNRWNAHHYLKGWNHSNERDKPVKEHDCLVPLLELPKNKQYTVLYDIYSILYIPNFLAKTNQKIKLYESLKIGVTGHRNIDNISSIENELKKEMSKLDKFYEIHGLIEIISPLADGADRLVAKVLMDVYSARLNVLLPFQEKEYMKTFLGKDKELQQSQNEFKELLKKALNIEVLTNVDEMDNNDSEEIKKVNIEHRDECYMDVGKAIVDQCDLLIALYDGEKPDGITKIGGTAYVVEYARKKGRPILHINTDNLEVKWDNKSILDKIEG